MIGYGSSNPYLSETPLRSSIRLPPSITGNAALQSVIVEVHDNNFDDDAKDPNPHSPEPLKYHRADGTEQDTKNYAVSLTNVPSVVNINTRVITSAEPQLGDPPGGADPCANPIVDESVGYVHAQLDLANAVDANNEADLDINTRVALTARFGVANTGDGPTTDAILGLSVY